MSSTSPEYADRLVALEGAGWRRFVPNPYAWNIRRLATGRVLDVGCGIGRCLSFLEGRGVGVDPNEAAIEVARRRGFDACTPDEWAQREPEVFDSLLCSHVVEHLTHDDAREVLAAYTGRIRDEGRLIVIVPQERGHRSDPTHVRLVDADDLRRLFAELGWPAPKVRSFPGPRWLGRWFTHNETVAVSDRRAG